MQQKSTGVLSKSITSHSSTWMSSFQFADLGHAARRGCWGLTIELHSSQTMAATALTFSVVAPSRLMSLCIEEHGMCESLR